LLESFVRLRNDAPIATLVTLILLSGKVEILNPKVSPPNNHEFYLVANYQNSISGPLTGLVAH